MAVAGLLCIGGCAPTAAPPVPEPRSVRVSFTAYYGAHPSAGQLQSLDREIARLERDPAVRVAPSDRPAPHSTELPMPPQPLEEPPDLAINRRRAETEIRQDFTMRRDALPSTPPQPEPAPARAAGPAVTQAPPPVVEPERQTGLELQISRLNEQLERLREKPQDRLIYQPAQLRRRRELLEVIRSEINRLRQEQVARLRQALAPRDPEVVRRPVRPAPPPPPVAGAFSAATDHRLQQEEAAAVESLRRQPPLPVPSAPLAVPPPRDMHDEVRDRVATAVRNSNSVGRASTPVSRQSYARVLRRRREALRAAISRDVRAAAAVASRERGWVLTDAGGADDVTAALREPVTLVLRGAGLRGKP